MKDKLYNRKVKKNKNGEMVFSENGKWFETNNNKNYNLYDEILLDINPSEKKKYLEEKDLNIKKEKKHHIFIDEEELNR